MYDEFAKSHALESATGMVASASRDGKANGEQKHIFQSLQYLRKLCNHPALILKGDESAIKSALSKVGVKDPAAGLSEIQHAPKLLALK